MKPGRVHDEVIQGHGRDPCGSCRAATAAAETKEAPDDGSLRSARPNCTGRLISIIVCEPQSAGFQARVEAIMCIGGVAAAYRVGGAGQDRCGFVAIAECA
jgi:hypothetical protein